MVPSQHPSAPFSSIASVLEWNTDIYHFLQGYGQQVTTLKDKSGSARAMATKLAA